MRYFSTRVTLLSVVRFFFFNDTATTEIYTLSLHDALPIWRRDLGSRETAMAIRTAAQAAVEATSARAADVADGDRSEEHTSELQSRQYLVCRLLLEKKNNK